MPIKPEIIVVDDDSEAASAFADLIQSRLKIQTMSESNVDAVLDHVRKFGLKVAVLDQRMPKMTGTELYRSIKKINPYIKAIMITGEADRKEVAEAMESLGYVGFIEKNELENLHKKVIQAYAKYESSIVTNEHPIPLSVYNILKNHLFTIKYEIVSMHIANEEFIFPERWETKYTLEATEEEVEETVQYENELVLSSENTINGNVKFSHHFKWLPSFETELDAAITKVYGQTSKKNHRCSRKIKTTYRLQDNIAEGKTAVKKIYEHSPIFTQYEIVIKRSCRLCGLFEVFPVTVYKRQPKIANRIRIYHADGTSYQLDTGSTTL